MATTAACGDDDCELRGWLTMPGQRVMTSNEDADGDDHDDNNDTDEHYDVTLHGETTGGRLQRQ